MKIACISDQHFGSKNGNIGFHQYYEKFYRDIFFPYIDQHNITHIIDLGDTFDIRTSIQFDSLDRCRRYWFDEINKRGIHLDILVGNHCTPFKTLNSINSPNLLLNDYTTITVHDKPVEVNYGQKILFIPWICDETHEQTFRIIEETSAPIAMGHLELAGFEMHKGVLHSGGQPSDPFRKFRLVLSGHFHTRSRVTVGSNTITYLGCPYEMSWADYNDKKGFHIFDTETMELEFIPNPYRMHRKVFYDDTKFTKFDPVAIKKTLDNVTGSTVKLIVLEKTNPLWFEKFVKLVQDLNPLRLQIEDQKFTFDSATDEVNVEEIGEVVDIIESAVEDMDESTRSDVFEVVKELYYEALSRRC